MNNQKMLPARFVITILTVMMISASCSNKNGETDAYGNFEADEVIISAQAQGEILSVEVAEGSNVEKGQLICTIDSTLPMIKQAQLLAQQSVINARLKNLAAQLRVQEEQRINLAREVERTEKLFMDHAATQQQFDEITGKLKVLDLQTEAIRSQKSIIQGEKLVLSAQLDELANTLAKCHVISPIKGTVLEQYVESGELVNPGKNLIKLANVEEMELRVYISGSQLSSIAIGDSATIFIDSKDESLELMRGTVSWIASQVEFTPKIIQTREERINMVYAVKIRVRNEGRLKIGMPGEVAFGKK